MTLLEDIEKQLRALPPEKQSEVLDFIAFLQQRTNASQPVKPRSLKKHPAFGSWKKRKIDALEYQQKLRAETQERKSYSASFSALHTFCHGFHEFARIVQRIS